MDEFSNLSLFLTENLIEFDGTNDTTRYIIGEPLQLFLKLRDKNITTNIV